MLDDHAHVMQVKLCKANTRGVTMWNLTSLSLEIVSVPVQDRCTVCTKSTIGSQISLDAPDGTCNTSGVGLA